jgi:hypothetical protein
MSRQAKVTETDQVCCLTQRRAYMKLPLQERRKRRAAQAERMVDHYEQESGKWCHTENGARHENGAKNGARHAYLTLWAGLPFST